MLLRCTRCRIVIDLPDSIDAVHRVCSQCRGPLANASPLPPEDRSVAKTEKMKIIKLDDKPSSDE